MNCTEPRRCMQVVDDAMLGGSERCRCRIKLQILGASCTPVVSSPEDLYRCVMLCFLISELSTQRVHSILVHHDSMWTSSTIDNIMQL